MKPDFFLFLTMFPSEEELKERYATWATDRLFSVLHYKSQYTTLAVEVARAELGRRKITATDVDGFLQLLEEREAEKRIMSRLQLNFWEKALSFFIWLTPWFLERISKTADNRYVVIAKTRQSRFFSIAGFISVLADACCTICFRLPMRMSLLLMIILFLIFCLRETRLSDDLTGYARQRML